MDFAPLEAEAGDFAAVELFESDFEAEPVLVEEESFDGADSGLDSLDVVSEDLESAEVEDPAGSALLDFFASASRLSLR